MYAQQANAKSINEDTVEDHGYEEAAPDANRDARSNRSSIRVSALPKEIQASARKMDVDRDGALDAMEVGGAIVALNKKRKKNKSLKNTIFGFVFLSVMLTGGIFASSLTAANLSKDITVSSGDGVAYVKGSDSNQVMKTAEALVHSQGAQIGLFSNDELQRLKQVVFQDGDLKFDVKGHSRGDTMSIHNSEKVMLLVEGGTITYDKLGIVGSTGDARVLLEFSFGPDLFDNDNLSGRHLAINTCNMGSTLSDMQGTMNHVNTHSF